MPPRESTPAGAPVWTDITTTDLEAARAFYGGLFGWTFDESAPAEYGGYTSARLNGRLVAGFSPTHEEFEGVPNVWTVYLKSDDVEATSHAVQEAGGMVLLPPMHVAPFGHMALFVDAGQGVVGAWQPEEHQGFGVDSEHGAPAWHEVLTRSYSEAVAFYQKAFGWNTSVMSDTEEFRYTTLGEGDDARAGLMDASAFLPEGVPSHWDTYWGVDDTEAACAKAVELGGLVTERPQDTPYGRLAAISDPCGASLKIIQVRS